MVNLHFPRTRLLFDTVFTTIGSTTRSFKIYNGNNDALKFDEIRLWVVYRLHFD
jgi:hypothetical protein